MVCFQYDNAKTYYEALKGRLSKFELSIAEEKTNIIEFCRFAQERKNEKDEINQQHLNSLVLHIIAVRAEKGISN